MTYTEEQVQELIQTNLKLSEENAKLQERLAMETIRKESAERKYTELCERCISFYVTSKDIVNDTIFVQTTAPRFMTSDDFSVGVVQHLVNLCNAEREKQIFHDMNTSRCKPIE